MLDRGEPLPTLAEMVKSDHRLVVFTERDADGTVPWYLDGFSFIQDTPLGSTKVDQFSCKLESRREGQPDPDAQPLGRRLPAAPGRQRGLPDEGRDP